MNNEKNLAIWQTFGYRQKSTLEFSINDIFNQSTIQSPTVHWWFVKYSGGPGPKVCDYL